MGCKKCLHLVFFLLSFHITAPLNPLCLPLQTPEGASCYYIYHQQLTWVDASWKCRQHFGQLVNVSEASIQEEIVVLLSALPTQAPEPSHEKCAPQNHSVATAPPTDRATKPTPRPTPPLLPGHDSRKVSEKYWIGAEFTHGDLCPAIDPCSYTLSAEPCNHSATGFICQYETDGLKVENMPLLSALRNILTDASQTVATQHNDARRSLMFRTLKFLSRSAVNSSSELHIHIQEKDIDVRITSPSSLFEAKNLIQDGTREPHIWMQNDSPLVSSTFQRWNHSEEEPGLTVLSVRFPRLEEEMVSDDGVYSAVVSDILSYSVFVDGEAVSVPIAYKLSTEVKNATELLNSTHTRELLCVSMDEKKLMSQEWGWSTKGCFIESMQQGYALCFCSHTTNFALLMRILPVEVPETHGNVLSLITYVGCSISIGSSVLALSVFIILRLYSQDRTFIHINLVLSLLLLQMVFLTGASQIHKKDLCTAVSACLHYLSLAVFGWMLVEGIHLYRQVVLVFDSAHHKKVYAAIGYALPACVVGVAAAVHPHGYSDPERASCWLSMGQNFHWAFIGPAICIILVNIVITGQVLRIVVSAAHVTKQRSTVQVAARGLLVLAPITGLTWTFAFMAVSEETLVFQYIFAIFNSLQGVFIFLIHCVFNSEVRQAWSLWIAKKTVRRVTLSQHSTSSMEKRKVSGSSQDTADKPRFNVSYFTRSSGESRMSETRQQIATVECKEMNRKESTHSTSQTERVDFPPNPSVVWTV